MNIYEEIINDLLNIFTIDEIEKKIDTAYFSLKTKNKRIK